MKIRVDVERSGDGRVFANVMIHDTGYTAWKSLAHLKAGEKWEWSIKSEADYARLVLALRNLLDAPQDDNGAVVRIEMRRTARLLLAELGEVKVCLHGTGRITPEGWECAACGQKFSHDANVTFDGNPAHAWPGIPEFLKRKAP